MEQPSAGGSTDIIQETNESETTRIRYAQRTEVNSEYFQLDLSYLKSLSGLVKCTAIGLDLLFFITLLMISKTAYFYGTFWSMVVCSTAITVSLTLLTFYLFHVVDVFAQFPWIVSEMIFCFTWTIFFFIVASVLALTATTYNHFGFALAALFAFGAMSTYGFDCFLKFLSWKRNESAHGGAQNSPYEDTLNLSRNRERNEVI